MLALSDESLKIVDQNVRELLAGRLPPPTPAVFPRPAALKVQHTPWGDRIFLIYDPSGEAFEESRKLVKYAKFVQRSKTVLFLVDIAHLPEPGVEMQRLLNIYVMGMDALTNIRNFTRRQCLTIVYTKGDELAPLLEGYPAVLSHLREEHLRDGQASKRYFTMLQSISYHLEHFTERKLRAKQFLNFAKAHFGQVEFCVISSLGCSPEGDRLSVYPSPHRLLDPVVWILRNSMSWWERMKCWWFG